jgi:hypothetical protein
VGGFDSNICDDVAMQSIEGAEGCARDPSWAVPTRAASCHSIDLDIDFKQLPDNRHVSISGSHK